jgi:hypothetical protein
MNTRIQFQRQRCFRSLSHPLALLAIALSGCAAAADQRPERVASTVTTFEEWRESLPRNSLGLYMVEGDMQVPESELPRFYKSIYQSEGALLLTFDSSNVPIVWPAPTRSNLTYCVSNTWGAEKPALINAISWGMQQWQSATHNAVQFRYVPAQDANCVPNNSNVVFHIMVNNGPECASSGNCSFYPNWAPASRNLYFAKGFTGDSTFHQNGYAAHELGHMLGFGHEHSWTNGTSFQCGNQFTSPFFALTRFDVNSIMLYNPCTTASGVNIAGPNADWLLSNYDIRGASCAYEGVCEWIQLAGKDSVSDIDVDASANVWSFSNVLKDGGGNFLQKWNHSTLKWDTIATPTGGKFLTVDPSGTPWYVTATGDIYHSVSSGNFQLWPGKATDISMGANGALWAVTNQGVDAGNFVIAKWNGTWVPQTGIGGFRIAVDPSGAPFVVRTDGSLYHLENGSWIQWPGSVFDIDVGSDGSIWVIARNGTIWQWVVNHWELVTGAGQRIAVAQNGQPWVVGYDNATYIDRWVP